VPGAAIEAAGVEPVELGELLETSDVVSVHAPMTEENRHLIAAPELGRMRSGAFLVNTSRGPLVDLVAVRESLEAAHLGGVALDVLENEPPEPDDPLLRRPDVIVTPHAAFYSEEAMVEQQRKAAEQVVAALAGEIPAYAVNADAVAARRRD
jgi:D-3-phosphoglycerate dehydrogenase